MYWSSASNRNVSTEDVGKGQKHIHSAHSWPITYIAAKEETKQRTHRAGVELKSVEMAY